MGTEVSLSFVCADKETADTMAQHAFATIHTYEQRFSRFLPKSDVTLLNQHGTHVVSDVCIAVLERSLELARLTNYAFNPLVQVATLGYKDPDPHHTHNIHMTQDTSYSTDIGLIAYDRTSNRVTLGPAQQIDFGGILKGYLAHLLADDCIHTQSTCTGCIVNIGGDIATRGVDVVHSPFIFLLYNPIVETERPVTIQDASLATSGTYARHWQTDKGPQHHIVDSTTQKNPTQDVVAVSIIAQDGAYTEALTKLFLTRGVTEALRLLPPETQHYKYFAVLANGDSVHNL